MCRGPRRATAGAHGAVSHVPIDIAVMAAIGRAVIVVDRRVTGVVVGWAGVGNGWGQKQGDGRNDVLQHYLDALIKKLGDISLQFATRHVDSANNKLRFTRTQKFDLLSLMKAWRCFGAFIT